MNTEPFAAYQFRLRGPSIRYGVGWHILVGLCVAVAVATMNLKPSVADGRCVNAIINADDADLLERCRQQSNQCARELQACKSKAPNRNVVSNWKELLERAIRARLEAAKTDPNSDCEHIEVQLIDPDELQVSAIVQTPPLLVESLHELKRDFPSLRIGERVGLLMGCTSRLGDNFLLEHVGGNARMVTRAQIEQENIGAWLPQEYDCGRISKLLEAHVELREIEKVWIQGNGFVKLCRKQEANNSWMLEELVDVTTVGLVVLDIQLFGRH